jgi:hypothetical protein
MENTAGWRWAVFTRTRVRGIPHGEQRRYPAAGTGTGTGTADEIRLILTDSRKPGSLARQRISLARATISFARLRISLVTGANDFGSFVSEANDFCDFRSQG